MDKFSSRFEGWHPLDGPGLTRRRRTFFSRHALPSGGKLRGRTKGWRRLPSAAPATLFAGRLARAGAGLHPSTTRLPACGKLPRTFGQLPHLRPERPPPSQSHSYVHAFTRGEGDPSSHAPLSCRSPIVTTCRPNVGDARHVMPSDRPKPLNEVSEKKFFRGVRG